MKKGFTLTEVIVVIVILSVIILLAIPAYLGVTETLKKQNYDNKVKQIEIKATEWAEDNNLTENITISLARLIDEGYIQMDDETSTDKRVINPINNESMECYHIIISIENGNYKAKLEESKDCELKSQEEQANNIKVVGYEIDPNTNRIISNKELKVNGGELEWSGKDILLVTTSEVYKNPRSITFSTGSTNEKKTGNMYLGTPNVNEVINPNDYQNTYVVSASLILRSKYSITYEMEKENVSKSILVKIDKESPTGEASMLEKWGKNDNKKVKLSGSDGAGSGVKGFYINSINNINTATYYKIEKGSEVEVTLKVGNYYFWVEDNVGNRSGEGKIIEVKNIDDVNPECVYPEDRKEWTKGAVTIEWGCKDHESGCTTKTQSKTFSSGTVGSYTLPAFEISDAAGNKITCPAKQISIMIDTEAPSCNITTPAKMGKNSWYVENAVLTLETKDEGSGIAKKGLSTSNNTDYNNKTQVTQTSTSGVTYYGYVEDKLGNKANCSKGLKVDSVAPSCIVPSGNNNWTKNAVSIEWGCQDGMSGCTTVTQKMTFNQANSEVNTYRIYNGNQVIEDRAGNQTTCTQRDVSIKYDTKAPYDIQINNRSGGAWMNQNFNINVSANASEINNGSGIAYWQYSYDLANWVTYGNSNRNNFDTTDFSLERNQLVYIRAVDNVGNVSTNAETWIRIDKTPPSCNVNKSGGGAGGVTLTTGCWDNGDVQSGVRECQNTNGEVHTNGTYTYSVVDNANNSQVCSNSIEAYTVCRQQTRDSVYNSCPNSNCSCAEYGTKCTLYKCIRTKKTCSSGVLIDEDSPYASCWQGCRSCSDSGCVASVPDYFQGGCARNLGKPTSTCTQRSTTECETGHLVTDFNVCNRRNSCEDSICGEKAFGSWTDYSESYCCGNTGTCKSESQTWYR